MPIIKFFCSHCGEPIELDDVFAGRQIKCPYCFNVLTVPGGAPEAEPPPDKSAKTAEDLLASGARQARTVLNDLREISFKEEVLPIDGSNVSSLLTDFVFWAVTLLGIIPLLIVTVQNSSTQLTMFALFFAFVWGVILKRFVPNDRGSWKWPGAALFFTCIAGMWILLLISRLLLPGFYLHLADSANPVVSLFGYIFQVGIWEEFFKAIPLFLLLRWGPKNIRPLHLVTIGVFSGLGFAAFENLNYGENAVFSAYSLTRDYGVEGLVTGVQNAMVVTMLRAVSLVFCHAVWSGIVAYFIATAMLRKERVGALIVIGILVAAVLHGFYDWLAGIQPTVAALLAGFSFALFYGYLSKLKSHHALGSGNIGFE